MFIKQYAGFRNNPNVNILEKTHFVYELSYENM
jgi:hypothetical protein